MLVGWLAVAAAVGLDPLYAWTGTPERHFGVATWVLCTVVLLAGTALTDRSSWASTRRRIDPHGPLRWGLGTSRSRSEGGDGMGPGTDDAAVRDP